jgi:DNA polymerase-3 subunit delta
MMAERQVVIVKEAQDLGRTIDKLKVPKNPMPSTVFSDLLQTQDIR